MKQLRESVRRLKGGRKEDIVLVRRWFPQFCFHNMRCVRKLAAYASDAKADVIRYSPVRDVCECHSLFCYCIFSHRLRCRSTRSSNRIRRMDSARHEFLLCPRSFRNKVYVLPGGVRYIVREQSFDLDLYRRKYWIIGSYNRCVYGSNRGDLHVPA